MEDHTGQSELGKQEPSTCCLLQAAEQQALQLRDAEQHLRLVEGELESKSRECTDLLSESLGLKASRPGCGWGAGPLTAGVITVCAATYTY